MPRTSRPPVNDTRADTARTRLIAAGLECFASHGLDGVSIRTIAQKAERNSAAITYYFDSKEGLYRAVLASVLHFIRGHAEPVATDYARLNTAGELTPENCEALLKRLQHDMFRGVFGGTEALKFALLITREQIQPSAAFTSLYTAGLEPIHRMLTHLLAVATGDDPNSNRAIIRAHTHFGHLQIFVMARELLLRRLHWQGYEGGHADEVLAVLAENLDLILTGLRAKKARTPFAPVRQDPPLST